MNAMFCCVLVAAIAVVGVHSETCLGRDTTLCDQSLCATGFTLTCVHPQHHTPGGVCTCVDSTHPGHHTNGTECQTNHDCPKHHHEHGHFQFDHCPHHTHRSCWNGHCLCH